MLGGWNLDILSWKICIFSEFHMREEASFASRISMRKIFPGKIREICSLWEVGILCSSFVKRKR